MTSARTLDGNRTARWCLAAAVAIGAHAALAFGANAMPVEQQPATVITELELAPPPVEPPPVKPLPPEPEPAEEPDEPTHAEQRTTHVAANTAPAARAGKILAAKSDAPVPAGSEPVDFVTDPNGSTYAGGIVARGGTGEHGSRGTSTRPVSAAKGTAPVARPSTRSDIVPASNLSRPPSLSSGTNCRGYYPGSADADSAVVSLVVVVGSDGSIARLTVASESPAGQGFGAAARACIGTGRFSPAFDKSGHAVKSATRVRVRFTR